MKFYGRYGDLIQQYEVSLLRMLNGILILDQQWLPNQSDFSPISWPLYRAWPSPIMSGFHGAFATGVACQQGTLTLPDTWFRPPLWDLLVLQLLRPDSSNLPCLHSTIHLEYPLVLSRFYLVLGLEDAWALWFQKQVLWRLHQQDARVRGREHFHGFCGKEFQADSRHTNGNKLRPSSIRHLPLLIRSKLYM